MVTEIDGTRRIFNSVVETADYYCMTQTAVRNRIEGIVKNEVRKFEYTGEVLRKPPYNKKNKDDVIKTFNNGGFDEVSYETIGTRLCITECVKMKGVKVGSVRCKCCLRHRGQDRERHLVACGVKK